MWRAYLVLNLIITGIPSIPKRTGRIKPAYMVLNLIITGIPSIPYTSIEQVWVILKF